VRRAARLTAIVVAAALAVPAAASAHANVVGTDPPDRAALTQAPARVVVRFDDVVRAAPGNAAVRNGDGSVLAGKATAHGKTLTLPLRTALGRGNYSVRWSAVSQDGHVVQGTLAFSVGTGEPPPAPTLHAANETGFGTVLSRFVFFAGLLVGAGLALFDLLVWRPLAGGHLRTGWIALGLAAMFVSSHGLVHASHGGLATRFGLTIEIASAIAATGAAAAAIAVADRSAAPFGIWLAVLLLPIPTVAGHALDPARSWLEVPVDVLHVTAAALWIGGLFALVVVVPREGEPSETLAAVVRRFSTLALASVVVVGLTGGVRALSELSAFSQLWTTDYGRVLLAKTAIFAVLIGLGALSRANVREGLGRLQNVVRVELALAVLLVVAVAILTSLRPGRS
jgi:copper transport protein